MRYKNDRRSFLLKASGILAGLGLTGNAAATAHEKAAPEIADDH